MSYPYLYPVQDKNAKGLDPSKTISRHWDGTDALDFSNADINVYNMAGGVVEKAVWTLPNTPTTVKSNAAGNNVKIRITDDCALQGCTVHYMHLKTNSNNLKKGDFVPRGGFVGVTGNSGNSSGPHLHVQIRDASGGVISYKRVNAGSQLRSDFHFDGEGIPRDSSGRSPMGVSDYLLRFVMPVLKGGSTDNLDLRRICTIAILEAKSLGLIGMEEVVGVVKNRIDSPRFPNTVYDVLSAKNQFSTWSENRNLMETGGYSKDRIDNEAPGLWDFSDKMLNGIITTSQSTGWTSGYNSLIKLAYYFRSDVKVEADYLYTRVLGSNHHYYNGINMWK